jgi:hypothetical protein
VDFEKDTFVLPTRSPKRRPFAFSSAFAGLILGGLLPYVLIQSSWSDELSDRIACVVVGGFMFCGGIGCFIHAFRGKPFTEISGEVPPPPPKPKRPDTLEEIGDKIIDKKIEQMKILAKEDPDFQVRF